MLNRTETSSDTLSRLKGIETLAHLSISIPFSIKFRYAFPFEGNWNPEAPWKSNALNPVQIRFPVWRELKPTTLKVMSYPGGSFRYAFPFEGNWNLSRKFLASTAISAFRYAFPFEGNWNVIYKLLKHFISCRGSDTLSRLKGIETPTTTRKPNARKRVQIRFPVWRELKLLCQSRHEIESFVQIRFPVWRELKRNCRSFNMFQCSSFRYAFPFEGNWNFL